MNAVSLTSLADRYTSDKGMLRPPHHGYTFVYEMLFHALRNQPVSILELGLARTSEDFRGRSEQRDCALSPSVEMWLQYFSNAHVTGFDLSDFSRHQDERFDFIQGDLGNADDYGRILDVNSSFDIVIDDGSHASYHQMLAFTELFSAVKKGGFYIIEDAWSQPDAIEQSQPTSHTVAQLFREFLRLGYFPDTQPLPAAAFNRFLGDIGNVLFVPYHNEQGGSDQLLVIFKQSGSRFHHYRSRIRFFREPPVEADRPSLHMQTRLDPENAYPWYFLAQLDFDKQDLLAASENMQQACRLGADDPVINLLDAKIVFASGQQQQALSKALAAMRGRQASEVIGIGLAEYLLEQNAPQQAEQLLVALLVSAPDCSRCHFLSGRVADVQKQWQTAEQHYRNAFERLPSRLAYLKAYVRMARKRKAPELPAYVQQYTAAFKGRSGYHQLLANTLLVYDRLEEALVQAGELLSVPDKADWARAFIEKHAVTEKTDD